MLFELSTIIFLDSLRNYETSQQKRARYKGKSYKHQIIASDHASFHMKEVIKKYLDKQKYDYEDFGTTNEEPVDYPGLQDRCDFKKEIERDI